MVLIVFLGLVGLSALRAFSNWRTGILLMILIAAIQDPVRKLVPGTPGWMTLATAPIFFASVLGAVMTTPGWWSQFRAQFPKIGSWLRILILATFPAFMISATYGPGSWKLTIMGVFSYSLIFLAVISGFHFARHLTDLRRVLAMYCIAHGVMLIGSLLEFSGLFSSWSVLGSKILGYTWRRDMWGYLVQMISGFYRSGDVMGWHAIAVSTLSLLLALTSDIRKRWLWFLISGVAVFALLVCGRRKMVFMLPVFAIALMWIYWQAGRKGKVWSIAFLMAMPAASVYLVTDVIGADATQIRYYKESSDETLDTFQAQGFRALYDTYDQSGFWGEGLGTATPGSHHIKVARPRIWQESGPSRVLVELGVPGALGFAAVLLTILLSVWRVTRIAVVARSASGPYAASMMAFFIANAGSLMVSGQILADPFIASFLGFLVGLTLACAKPEILGRSTQLAAAAPQSPGKAHRLPAMPRH